MKVLHITGSLSRKSGGLFGSVRRLAQMQMEQGEEVKVIGLADEFTGKDLAQWLPLEPVALDVKRPCFWGYAPGLTEEITAVAPDIVHLHGIWLYYSYAVSRLAAKTGLKYVVSPRGMLDQWALNNSGWKKALAGFVFQKRALQRAACLHALTEKEAEDIDEYVPARDVCVVPNGVDVPEDRPKAQGSRASRDASAMLYIGRLHPKKGLAELLRGWHVAIKQCESLQGWNLIIAGWDDGGHEAGLRRLSSELDLQDTVQFAGPVYGEAKENLLSRADGFIIPSLSEGLPMAVLEAWAHELPVIMTDACNLNRGFEVGAAMKITTESGSIAGALAQMSAMSVNERRAMGAEGVKLVSAEFSWETVALKMQSVYAWIINGRDKPDCVNWHRRWHDCKSCSRS